MTFNEAVGYWTDTINDWYDINATPEEVISAFNTYFLHKEAYDSTSYADMFFKTAEDGTWSRWLDTADREGLTWGVERARKESRTPKYGGIFGVSEEG